MDSQSPKNIDEFLEQLGTSGSALASAIGVSPRTVQLWRKRGMPTWATVLLKDRIDKIKLSHAVEALR